MLSVESGQIGPPCWICWVEVFCVRFEFFGFGLGFFKLGQILDEKSWLVYDPLLRSKTLIHTHPLH